MENTKERLVEIQEKLGLDAAEYANALGIAKVQSLYAMRSGSVKVSSKTGLLAEALLEIHTLKLRISELEEEIGELENELSETR